MLRIPFVLLWNLVRNLLRFPVNLLRLLFPVKKGSYVFFRIEHGIPRWERESWLDWWKDAPTDMTGEEWRDALEELATSPRIEGIVCNLKSLGEGLPALSEFVQLLADFRKSGKKVIVYSGRLSPAELFVASESDRFVLSPAAGVHLTAPTIFQFYYGRVIRRFGVEPSVFQIGEHKNAPETFTRAFPSATNRKDLEELIANHRKHFFADIAKSRGMSEDEFHQLLDEGVFSVEEALEHGLIDALRFPSRLKSYVLKEDLPALEYPEDPNPPKKTEQVDKAEDSEKEEAEKALETSTSEESSNDESSEESSAQPELKEVSVEVKDERSDKAEEVKDVDEEKEIEDKEADQDEEESKCIDLDDYYSKKLSWWRWSPLRKSKQIAIVPIEGVIRDEPSSSARGGERAAIRDVVIAALKEAGENDRVKAVVLFIDSRGGSGHASEAIWWAVRELDEKKPVIAYLDNYAASGGYYIACAAREIISSPWCMTGSIGVFGGKFVAEKLLQHLQVGLTVIGGSSGGRLFSPFHTLNEAEKERFKHQLHLFYRRFLGRVADRRDMTIDEVDRLAGGRVYFGRDALPIGLVDKCDTFLSSVERAKELAELSRYDLEIIESSPGFSVVEALSAKMMAKMSSSKLSDVLASSATSPNSPIAIFQEFEAVAQMLSTGMPVIWYDGPGWLDASTNAELGKLLASLSNPL